MALQAGGLYSAADLAADFSALGIRQGDMLMVHVSLRSIGRVVGNGVGLLEALLYVVGQASGTLIVPTFTTYLVDPEMWHREPVSRDRWPMIRATTPPYDPRKHPCQRSLGHFPELLRSVPNAIRSEHPIYSFAAVGHDAEDVILDHPLDFGLGRNSPLRKFSARGGKVVLLGVGWDKCTLLHLAEHEAPYVGRRTYDARVPIGRKDGVTIWQTTRQLVMHEGDFEQIGRHLESVLPSHGKLYRGRVGDAHTVVAKGDAVTREARRWLVRLRDLSSARLLEPYPGVAWEGIGSL